MYITEIISKIVSSGALSSFSIPLFPLGMLFLFMFSYDSSGTVTRAYQGDPRKKHKNFIRGISCIFAGLLLTPWSLNYLIRPLIHSVIAADIANIICSKEFPAFNIKNNLIWILCYVIPFAVVFKCVKHKI